MVQKTTADNSTANQSDGEVDAPQYVTVDQLNSAITARFRSFESKQTESLSRIESLLVERQKPVEEAVVQKPTKKSQEDDLVVALQNQVKILQEKDKRARENGLRVKAHEELVAGGVNPKAVKPLLAMFEAEKVISYASDQSDEVIFKTEDSVFTLKDGINTWLRSEDAKPFLAPKGTAGSGDKPYTSKTTSKPQAGKLSMEQAGDALLSLITGSGE